LGIFENNFTDFREAVSLKKIFEIVQENTLKCSKLISFLGNKKLSSNQNVWHDHTTMQQDVLLYFWAIFLIEIRLKYEKNILLSSSRSFSLSTPIENSYLSALELFHCLPPLFLCLPLWKTVMLQYATNISPHCKLPRLSFVDVEICRKMASMPVRSVQIF
jgi:hypothetical protein